MGHYLESQCSKTNGNIFLLALKYSVFWNYIVEGVEPARHFFQLFEFLVILVSELIIHLFKSLFPVSVNTLTAAFSFL